MPVKKHRRRRRKIDPGLRQKFKELSADGELSSDDMNELLEEAFDGGKITRTERRQLRRITTSAKAAQNLDRATKNDMLLFLNFCDWLELRPWSFAKLQLVYAGGKVPKGWYKSEYHSKGAGPCAVQLSLALKKGGFVTFGDFPSRKNKRGRHVWPKAYAKRGLPVNAKELAEYLERRIGPPTRIDVREAITSLRQGIVYMTGFQRASGHITLWDGGKSRFEDGNWFTVVEDPINTKFWDLRPTWLKLK